MTAFNHVHRKCIYSFILRLLMCMYSGTLVTVTKATAMNQYDDESQMAMDGSGSKCTNLRFCRTAQIFEKS